jgi:hypothetical protein
MCEGRYCMLLKLAALPRSGSCGWLMDRCDKPPKDEDDAICSNMRCSRRRRRKQRNRRTAVMMTVTTTMPTTMPAIAPGDSLVDLCDLPAAPATAPTPTLELAGCSSAVCVTVTSFWDVVPDRYTIVGEDTVCRPEVFRAADLDTVVIIVFATVKPLTATMISVAVEVGVCVVSSSSETSEAVVVIVVVSSVPAVTSVAVVVGLSKVMVVVMVVVLVVVGVVLVVVFVVVPVVLVVAVNPDESGVTESDEVAVAWLGGKADSTMVVSVIDGGDGLS